MNKIPKQYNWHFLVLNRGNKCGFQVVIEKSNYSSAVNVMKKEFPLRKWKFQFGNIIN